MKNIFISYRRSDSPHVTGRVYEHLSQKFNKNLIFKDVDSIPAGVDFRSYIKNEIEDSFLVIAVIGKGWLSATDSEGKRKLDNPNDWVRIEIETALNRDIPVIPLLIDDTSMPTVLELPESLRNLPYRNNLKIRSEPDFRGDIERLIRKIEGHIDTSDVTLDNYVFDENRKKTENSVLSISDLFRKKDKFEKLEIAKQNIFQKSYAKVSRYLEDNLQENLAGESRLLCLKVLETKEALARSKGKKVNKKKIEGNLNRVYFEKRNNGRILILGEPGSGKTISLFELAKNLMGEGYGNNNCVPIIVNSSDWKVRYKRLDDWLLNQVRESYLNIDTSIFRQLLESNDLAFFVDGLDEIDKSCQDQFINCINNFLKTSNCSVVVCCRNEEYFRFEHKIECLNNAYRLLPPANSDIKAYLSSIDRFDIWEKMSEDKNTLELAKKPFLLNVMLPVIHEMKIKDEKDLISAYITQKLSEYDELSLSKGVTKYTKKEILYWLHNIASRIKGNKFLIEEIDIKGLNIFQAVFCRLIVSTIIGLAACIVLIPVLLVYQAHFLTVDEKLIQNTLLRDAKTVFLLAASLIFFMGSRLEKSSFNVFASRTFLRFPRREDIFRGAFVSVFMVAIYGMVTAPVFSTFSGILGNLWTFMYLISLKILGSTDYELSRLLIEFQIMGSNVEENKTDILILFSCFSLLTGFITGLKAPIKIRDYPNQGFWECWKSFWITIIITLPFTAFVAKSLNEYILGYTPETLESIVNGFSISFTIALVTGGFFCAQHISLRLTYWAFNLIPLKLQQFLQHAIALKLLGRLGGEYYFIHSEIWELFADKESVNMNINSNDTST